MAIINKGKSFANGEQLTADKLNQVIDNATFTTSAVDNVSTQLAGGAIVVKDGGVTFAKLTDVIDDDTMATASATKLATSESIKAYVDNVSVFTKSFESAEQDIPAANAAVLTISHGLGEIPKLMEMVYRCKTNDNGWIAGDEIVTYSQSDSGLGDWAVVKNSAEVKFRGVSSQRKFAHGTSSNTAFSPASPNWKIVFRAYA